MTLALGLLPLLVPAAALALTFAVRRPGTVLGVARTCGAALWLLGLLVVLRPPADWDAFARWYCLLVLALGGLGLWVSVHYVGTEHLHGEVEATGLRRYFLLYEGFVLSLLAVGALPNYVAIWAAVEGTTLTTVLLVAFPGGQRPVEAAWKYVVVTGIGGLFGLLGTCTARRWRWTVGRSARPVPCPAPADGRPSRPAWSWRWSVTAARRVWCPSTPGCRTRTARLPRPSRRSCRR